MRGDFRCPGKSTTELRANLPLLCRVTGVLVRTETPFSYRNNTMNLYLLNNPNPLSVWLAESNLNLRL